jgi:hypothetical protein
MPYPSGMLHTCRMHFHNFKQNLICILHSKLQLFIFWQEIWNTSYFFQSFDTVDTTVWVSIHLFRLKAIPYLNMSVFFSIGKSWVFNYLSCRIAKVIMNKPTIFGWYENLCYVKCHTCFTYLVLYFVFVFILLCLVYFYSIFVLLYVYLVYKWFLIF